MDVNETIMYKNRLYNMSYTSTETAVEIHKNNGVGDEKSKYCPRNSNVYPINSGVEAEILKYCPKYTVKKYPCTASKI